MSDWNAKSNSSIVLRSASAWPELRQLVVATVS
jgi:hypothetical protein